MHTDKLPDWKFCAPSPELLCSILPVDPTFCTPISYHHLMLVSRHYGKHPVFIGPVLIHHRKNFATFLFFASSLIWLRKSLEAIRVFGTDGEIALVDAFSHEFRFSTHLFSFNHVHNNIKKELQSWDYWVDFREVGWWCVFWRYCWCWKWRWILWEAWRIEGTDLWKGNPWKWNLHRVFWLDLSVEGREYR